MKQQIVLLFGGEQHIETGIIYYILTFGLLRCSVGWRRTTTAAHIASFFPRSQQVADPSVDRFPGVF